MITRWGGVWIGLEWRVYVLGLCEEKYCTRDNDRHEENNDTQGRNSYMLKEASIYVFVDPLLRQNNK